MESQILFIIFTAIFFCCSSAGAECPKSPLIFNFGDSNSDTGGYAAARGVIFPYPIGRKFFHKSSDRFSDGRIIIDFLCENAKMDLLSSYLESLTPNFKNGVNFAVGGSVAFSETDFFTLSNQILEFKRFHTRPAGCLPRMLATSTVVDFDEAGCLKPLNEAAQEFNSQLRNLSEQLRAQLMGVTMVYVDMYTIKYDLISNFALYGFENPLMACCGGGGAPYNANPNIICGGTGFSVCDEDSRYISWDGLHYTDNANQVFAARIATTNYSTPPLAFDSVLCS
nr:GDSL esterase/lipase LIP-4-like [Ipomoea batatas]